MRVRFYTAGLIVLAVLVTSYYLTTMSETSRIDERDRRYHAIGALAATASGTVVFWTVDNRLISLGSSTGLPGWERTVRSTPINGVLLRSSEGRVFALAASGIVAIDTASGETVWTHECDDPFMGFLDIHGAAVSYADSEGTFYSRSVRDGECLASPRLPFPDACMIQAYEGSLLVLANSFVGQVGLDNGQVSWRLPVASGTVSRIACAGIRLFLASPDPSDASQSVLTAIAIRDGTPGWSTGIASPAVVDLQTTAGIVCVLTAEDGLFAFDQETGAGVWRSRTYRAVSPFALCREKAIFGTHASGLVAVNIRDGSECWSMRTDGPIRVAPVPYDSVIFAGTRRGVVLAVGEDGRPLWRFAVH